MQPVRRSESFTEQFEQNAQKFYANSQSVWDFSQMFGEEDNDGSEADGSTDNYISSLSFDPDGELLAVGYNCGQVVILTQQEDQTYLLFSEFKSHDPEFDCLTSTEIEEKINMLRWYPFKNQGKFLMTTNDKTIKLFKLWDKGGGDGNLDVVVKQRKLFAGAHAYNINSVSFNSDGETFISTDDLRINLWHMNVQHETFAIVNIKPEDMEELTEVITCSEFHPKDCNLLVYATSKGIIRMGDLRDSALCTSYSKEFQDTESDISGFFQELVTTISDVKFSPCGRFLVSRDYLTMKVWDPRMETRALRTIKFHDRIMPSLCDLYEDDSIFDKFTCAWSGDSLRLITGSYNGLFYVCDTFGQNISQMGAAPPNASPRNLTSLDSSQKVLHTAWHPKNDIVALGSKDFGFLYIKRLDDESNPDDDECSTEA